MTLILSSDAIANLALAVVLSQACAAPDARVDVAVPEALLHAVAVQSLEIDYDADPFESARRTRDVLDALWVGSGWTVFTPRQFSFRDRAATDLLQGTDLVFRAQALGLDPRRFALLRSRASLRQAHGQAVVARGDEIAVGRDFRASAVATLELTAMDGSMIADVEAVRDHDPFAARPDYDERPAVRDAVRAAVQSLIEACASCFVSIPRPALPVYSNPVQLLDQQDSEGRALRAVMEAAGPLERDPILWRVMQYVRPELDLPDAQRLAALPPAACLGPEPPAGLAPGECIVAVDGRPIDGVFALGRALAPAGDHVLTVIGTDGRRRQLGWPLP